MSVSVIIPSYNCAAYVQKAIESVLAQTYTDHEIIVVDDGSTDQTAAVVQPYLDRIRYIYQANKGLPSARNTGIRASTGSLIALLDADDSWLPEKLTKQVPLFADPEIAIVYSDFCVEYADGRFLASYLSERPLAGEGYVLDNYLRSRFLFPSTMLLRRSAVEAAGLFDEEMLAAEDIELFARICLRWKVKRVDEVLMVRTEGANNITANGSKMNDYTIRAFQKILAREPDLPRSTSTVLHQELGRQHWWRAYARYKSGRLNTARQDLWSAMRHDSSNVRQCLPLLIASWLPSPVVRRLRRQPQPGAAA